MKFKVVKVLRSSALVLLATSALITVGCGGGESQGDSDGSFEPEQPIEILVQASAGGASDLNARLVAEIMQDEQIVEQPISITNQPGGSGAVAYSNVLDSEGDPYTAASATGSFIALPEQGNVPYEIDEFTIHAWFAVDDLISVVPEDSEYESLQDVVEAAEEDPGGIRVGGTQAGAADHVAMSLLEQEADVDMNYVPYDSDSEVNAALLGGDVDMAFPTPGGARELIDGDRLRPLATLTEEPLDIPALEGVPTAEEEGYDVQFSQPRGIVGPPGLSEEEQQFWVESLRQVTETEAWDEYLEDNALRPEFITGEEAQEFANEQSQIYDEQLDVLGITE